LINSKKNAAIQLAGSDKTIGGLAFPKLFEVTLNSLKSPRIYWIFALQQAFIFCYAREVFCYACCVECAAGLPDDGLPIK